jgi:excisionase family DNA binding protein
VSASSDRRKPAALEPPEGAADGLSEPLLTAEEAARLLHVPRSTLYELVRSRHLPHVRVGRGLRFTRADLSQWIAENTFR